MQRSLRSNNTCQTFQNIFTDKSSQFCQYLIQQIPTLILNKIRTKRYLTCQDIENISIQENYNQQELINMKKARTHLKSKIDNILLKENEEKQNNNQYFDCLFQIIQKNKQINHTSQGILSLDKEQQKKLQFSIVKPFWNYNKSDIKSEKQIYYNENNLKSNIKIQTKTLQILDIMDQQAK